MHDEELRELTLEFAGRQIPEAWYRIARYCGPPQPGALSETRAFRYYDMIDTNPHHVGPVDVLAAASLHPGLSRSDLGWFWDHADELDAWLEAVSADLALRDAGDEVLDHVDGLAALEGAPSLSLLTKVLHRKRPELIPLVDRHIVDWYRPVTGQRAATAAWPGLLRFLRVDLGGLNALLIAMMNVEIENRTGRRLTHLRLLDIAIWMGGQR